MEAKPRGGPSYTGADTTPWPFSSHLSGLYRDGVDQLKLAILYRPLIISNNIDMKAL